MVIGYYVTLAENNICDFLRKSKIKTCNILNYYFSVFCTIKMHTSWHMIGLLLAAVAYLGLSFP